MTVIHESADILRYEDGAPYIHDILTNNTDKTITETQYCMLAFDENGIPLKLHWNFLDSSAESSLDSGQRQIFCLPKPKTIAADGPFMTVKKWRTFPTQETAGPIRLYTRCSA